jgi:hypothetical protein
MVEPVGFLLAGLASPCLEGIPGKAVDSNYAGKL